MSCCRVPGSYSFLSSLSSPSWLSHVRICETLASSAPCSSRRLSCTGSGAPSALDSQPGHHCSDTSSQVHRGDTIAAIVTGQQGAVAIIRVSGPSCVATVREIFRLPNRRQWKPQSHRVQYGFVTSNKNTIVDEAIVVPMLAPRSYTREDVVEIQCHGGDVCARRVLQVCLEAGARLAQPGEFTLRAFLNGRIDLAQAENVSELIAAKTEAAAETALAGLQGGLSASVASMRRKCIELLAEIEARLDFEDELPSLDVQKLSRDISEIESQIEEALQTATRGRLLRSGIQVAIVGRPNVGKSSLLNAWSKNEKAIVTDIPGTTRDIVEAEVVVGGMPVKLLDTAGIRTTEDVVERIGVQRSEAAAGGADVLVFVVSARDGWTVEDQRIFNRIWKSSSRRRAVLVANKIDLARARAAVKLPKEVESRFCQVLPTCALTRTGLDQLESAILRLMRLDEVSLSGRHWAVNQRHTEQLVRAAEALARLRSSVQQGLPLDFWTVDLREAALALGQISGDDVSEEVLANIFSRFCIGK